MPTYELRCEDCGNAFEKFLLRLLRDRDKVCPSCGSTRVSRGVGGGVVTKVRGTTESGSACGPTYG